MPTRALHMRKVRYPGLPAGTDRLGFEEYAMVPSSAPAGRQGFLTSVHVSTKPTC